jgi:hypothetical protein
MPEPPSPDLLTLLLQGVKSQFLGFVVGGIAGPLVLEAMRQWIFRAKIKLSFRPDNECISRTTEGPKTMDPGPRAVYVRMKVVNDNWRMAKNCKAYLVRIEKQDDQGRYVPTVYCDGMQLCWSAKSSEEKALEGVDLPKDVPQFVDVISVRENSMDFQAEVGGIRLYRHETLWREKGTFRATVSVGGDNLRPAEEQICFSWDGNVETLKVWSD